VLVAVAVAVRRSPPARPWCALLLAQGVVLLSSPAYFPHYATYVAPALALVVGATVAELLSVLRRFATGWAPVAVAVAVLAGAGLLAASELRAEGRRYPGREARAAVADARCVAADAPAILVTGDLLGRDLRNGCPVVVDPTGLVYDLADPAAGSTLSSRRGNREWQREMQRWFAGSDAVVLRRHNRAGLSAETLRGLTRGRELSRHGRYLVYLRR